MATARINPRLSLLLTHFVRGVFLPENQEQPFYFVEVQFQKDNRFYARFFSEIFLYLYQNKRVEDWRGVVIYPTRTVEGNDTSSYGELLNSSKVRRFYLDEIDDGESLGVATLKLIVSPPENAISEAGKLIEKVRAKREETVKSQKIIELIETILVYKLPQLSRQEIEAMFSINDLKQTKVYQEALEEGRQEGRQEGELDAKINAVPRLLALGLTLEQISTALELDLEQIRRVGGDVQEP